MVEINYSNYKLTAKGHAGGVAGTDIVCASISTLFYTLAYNLTDESIADRLIVKDYGEVKEVSCIPINEAKVKAIYDVILGGIRMIAEEYPDKVQIK